MITQERINQMTGPELAAWFNEHLRENEAAVRKFRTLPEGRDRVYHKAYEMNLLATAEKLARDADLAVIAAVEQATPTEPPAAVLDEVPATDAEVAEYIGQAHAPRLEIRREQEVRFEITEVQGDTNEYEPETTDLPQTLRLKEGTHKAKIAKALIDNLGSYVTLQFLAEQAYGNTNTGAVKMVLRGVRVALGKYAPHLKLVTQRGGVGLFPTE